MGVPLKTSNSNGSTLILHPKIYLDFTGACTDALLIDRDGVVLATGRNASLIPAGRTLKPEAACLFPALADSHIHLWSLGMRLGLVDLKGAPDPESVYERLSNRTVTSPPSGWIQGHGWDQHLWDDHEMLRLERLDRMFPDTPVCLYRVDYHAGFVNSAALRAANYHACTEIVGGHLERDSDGALTGLLLDEALNRLTDVIPKESEQELEQIYKQKAAMLRGFGVTSAHMAWTGRDGARMARQLHRRGELGLRLFCMVDAQDPEIEAILEEGPYRDERCQLAIDCVKFFADGAMGSGGALMLEPYRDGTSGLAVTSRESLCRRVPELVERGWHVATHAIGDAAARHVLDAYALARSHDASALLRLEHAQLVTSEDLERLAQHDVFASVQPIHMYSDSPWAPEVLSSEQLDRLYRWRDLAYHTELCAGSDYPIDDPNPWHGVATFVSRRNAQGEIWRPEQALTRVQALNAYTAAAAAAAGWGEHLAQLHEEFYAEVIALKYDPFVCSLKELWEMEAELIYSLGEVVC